MALVHAVLPVAGIVKRKSYAKRRDANEPEIVKGLEQVGASVLRLDNFDLLVGWGGADYKLEVKSEDGQLNAAQMLMIASWRGSPHYVVRNLFDALRVIGAQEFHA